MEIICKTRFVKTGKDKRKVSYILIGLVKDVKIITQKNGMKMGKVLLEDYNGTIEITLFHEAWAKYEASMVVGKVLGFQYTFSEYKGVMGSIQKICLKKY